MNKFVKKELEKCRIGLPTWDDNTTQLVIPLHSDDGELNTKSEYIIQIKNYIINEPPNFTLSMDWNLGTVPPETQMKVKYVDNKGKMTKVDGVGLTTNIHWSGWLPNKSFEVIE